MLRTLAGIVGDDHVLTDPDVVAGYATDWTGEFTGSTPAVVRPGSVAEVSAVMSACHEAGMPVVVQGGNTGLVGGGVPRNGEVVLSTRRLTGVGESADGTIRAQAGTTLAEIHEVATARDLFVGIDSSARDSATIGGMVATNGGGIHTIRMGRVRDQLLDAEVCLVDGTHVDSVLLHANPAAELWRVVCGSEGTLAVILGVTLRTERSGAERLVILIPTTHGEVTDLARRLVVLPSLWAFELLGAGELELSAQALGRRSPLDAECMLLVEFRGPPGLEGTLIDSLGDVDGVVAAHPAEQDELWALRHVLPSAAHGVADHVAKLDFTVPLGAIGQLRAAVSDGPTAYLWGHVYTGPPGGPFVNCHINIAGDIDHDAMLDIVEGLDGSVVGEHGVGVVKRHRLDPVRPDIVELIMRKQQFDPDGLLNPGVLIPGDASSRRLTPSPQQVSGDVLG
ncbi:MAG TPA: FAD-binding oxidoreductase [Acidimicrobiia bacterium]